MEELQILDQLRTMRSSRSKRLIFIGIILIAMSVVFRESLDSFRMIFLGIGALFFIAGMAARRKERNEDLSD